MATVYKSYFFQSLLDGCRGFGIVTILRIKSPDKVEAGFFMVDSFCLGVRDAHFTTGSLADIEEQIDEQREKDTIVEKSGAFGRQFIEAAVDYAKRLGFSPHRDYKKACRVFGGLKVDGPLQGFEFGQDGKPFYIQSHSHEHDTAQRIVAQLERVCGEGNFHYTLLGGAFDDGDDEYDDDDLLTNVSESGTGTGDEEILSAAGAKELSTFKDEFPELFYDFIEDCDSEERAEGSTAERFLDVAISLREALHLKKPIFTGTERETTLESCRIMAFLLKAWSTKGDDWQERLQLDAANDGESDDDQKEFIQSLREFLDAQEMNEKLAWIAGEDVDRYVFEDFIPVGDIMDGDRPRILVVYRMQV